MGLIDNFRQFLLSNANIAAIVEERAHYGHVPQKFLGPYIWFQRVGSDAETTRAMQASGDKYHFSELYDLESVDLTPEGAEALAEQIRQLDGYCHNQFGTGTVQGLFVDDASDVYQPYNVGGDDGRHVSAVRITIMGYGE